MPIHLISANHTTAQSSPSGEPETNVQRNYADTLAALIRKVGAQWVAEEYSEEAEEESGRLSLTPKIADENGAKHRFCDPTKEERMKIGYVGQQELHLYIGMHDDDWNISNDEARRKSWALDIGKYFEVRERFWLDKIADLKDKTVVFVLRRRTRRHFYETAKGQRAQDVHVAARSVGGITDGDQRNIAEGLVLERTSGDSGRGLVSRVYPNAGSGSE